MTIEATVTMTLQEYEERRRDQEELVEDLQSLRSEAEYLQGELDKTLEKLNDPRRISWGVRNPDGEIYGFDLETCKIIAEGIDVQIVRSIPRWEDYHTQD